MKLAKSPIKEDKYLNVKIDTYPMEFSYFDSLFYDLNKFNYCVLISDGEKDIVVEYAKSKLDALNKHKEHYDRLKVRSSQFFDLRKRKFLYINYQEEEEQLRDIVTIEKSTIKDIIISDIMNLTIKGANSALIFYTKREATDYLRYFIFTIFSGLRVKVGQLKYTGAYNNLKVTDAKEIKTLVNGVDHDVALEILNSLYNEGEFQDKWEIFQDIIERVITEYYKDGDRQTDKIPNYVLLEPILKETEEKLSLIVRAPKKEVKKVTPPPKAAPKPVAKVIETKATPSTGNKSDLETLKKLLDKAPADKLSKIKELLKDLEISKESTESIEANISTEASIEAEIIEAPQVEEVAATISEAPSSEATGVTTPPQPEMEGLVEPPTKGKGPYPNWKFPALSPDGSNIYPENIPGPIYVDDKCISCDACVQTAPNFFVIDDDHAYLYNQPVTPEELANCDEAIAGCPVSAINRFGI